jgi:hypothetical protein
MGGIDAYVKPLPNLPDYIFYRPMRVREEAEGRQAPCAGGRDGGGPLHGHAANGQHGHGDGLRDSGQALEAENAREPGL